MRRAKQILLCAAALVLLSACAYRGVMPMRTTDEATTTRYPFLFVDLPLLADEVAFTEWLTLPETEQTGGIPAEAPAERPRYHTGISVEPRTMRELEAFFKAHPVTARFGWSEAPRWRTPYALGGIDAQTRQNALHYVNTVRFIAGVPANLVWDDENAAAAQAAALLQAANNSLSHTPERPPGMSDALFGLGYIGAQNSNMAAATREDTLRHSLRMCMEDSDAANIEKLGHRRWLLNPALGRIAAGLAGNYFAMTVTDDSNSAVNAAHAIVMYPAQVQPLQYFWQNAAWTVSLNEEFDITNARVLVLARGSGESWQFPGAGDFYLSESGTGQPRCVIFRPDMRLAQGGVYDVQITGVLRGGQDWLIQYTVQFV